MKRRDIVLGGAGAAMSAFTDLAAAQEFPRPGTTIKHVVPFAPGGLTDAMARMVGQKLSDAWKEPVEIDNKAGWQWADRRRAGG